MTKQDRCRFCRIYALGVVAFAALLGAGMAIQMGMDLSRFMGHDLVMRVLLVSAARSLAPAVAGSALLVAFVVWAHPLVVSQLEAELPPLLERALLVSLPGYAVAVLIVAGAGLLVSHLMFGVPWAAGRLALGFVGLRDWSAGVLGALADAGLIVFLAWRYLARLQAGKSSLPSKLVLAWTFGTGLRMTVGLLISFVVPG